MPENRLINLDIQCAETGRQLAEIKGDKDKRIEEKVLNEALSVLEEQGPYAMFLYVRARHDKIATAFDEACKALLQNAFKDRLGEQADVLDIIKSLAEGSLDDLLFARDLLRTALSYARYHLKARGGGSE
jgi:hypothetical protein